MKMVSRSPAPFIAVALICAASVSALSRSAEPDKPDQRYVQVLQPLLDRFVQQQRIPGLAIGIVNERRLAYAHAFGVKDLRHPGDPLTTRSLFHMASITKPFVATAIMQLVDRGTVDLDAPVVKYVPYFRIADDRYNRLTVRDFITHTSGMPDVENYEWDKPQNDDGALERYVRSLTNQKLLFAPGERFRYSNMAFEVLGDVVAKASGETFEDYVGRHILAPLRMNDSTILKPANPKFLTWGHELNAQGLPVPSPVFPYSRMHSPSSNLHSNILDMARWAIANMNGGELDGRRILQSSTHERMWTATHATGGPSSARPWERAVGLSWFVGEYRGTRWVGHRGGDTGYRTDLALLPDKGIAVVWMENADWTDRANNDLTRAALDVALGVPPARINGDQPIKQ
jgi:CubicO group peptidase (beta-lactamase class C family)